MFSQQDLEARINAANEEMVTGEEVPNAPPDPNSKSPEQRMIGTGKEPAPWVPIDLYRNNQRKQMENSRKEFPKGSRALVKYITELTLNGGDGREGLAHAKKRAEDDSEVLKAQGYKDRAELRLNQYMEEKFLPAVEIVVNYTSPDELLNCKEALKAFDDMALGVGSMRGYTAAYIRQAYGDLLGQTRGNADPSAVEEMRRIKMLIGDDQIRTAIGMAQRLKRRVDNGETIIEPEDYAVLGRIVAYAN